MLMIINDDEYNELYDGKENKEKEGTTSNLMCKNLNDGTICQFGSRLRVEPMPASLSILISVGEYHIHIYIYILYVCN